MSNHGLKEGDRVNIPIPRVWSWNPLKWFRKPPPPRTYYVTQVSSSNTFEIADASETSQDPS